MTESAKRELSTWITNSYHFIDSVEASFIADKADEIYGRLLADRDDELRKLVEKLRKDANLSEAVGMEGD